MKNLRILGCFLVKGSNSQMLISVMKTLLAALDVIIMASLEKYKTKCRNILKRSTITSFLSTSQLKVHADSKCSTLSHHHPSVYLTHQIHVQHTICPVKHNRISEHTTLQINELNPCVFVQGVFQLHYGWVVQFPQQHCHFRRSTGHLLPI